MHKRAYLQPHLSESDNPPLRVSSFLELHLHLPGGTLECEAAAVGRMTLVWCSPTIGRIKGQSGDLQEMIPIRLKRYGARGYNVRTLSRTKPGHHGVVGWGAEKG